MPDKPAAGAIFPVIERSHDMRATAATANDDRFADVSGEAYINDHPSPAGSILQTPARSAKYLSRIAKTNHTDL